MSPNHEILHVSDTALMVAACRAMETDRADGFVRDPFAARVAGERGMAIARATERLEIMCFGIGVRSRFVDELLLEAVAVRGIRTVLNIGCGLDTRPWRLDLPVDLRWIEVDFPEMLEYKNGILATDPPRCRREFIAADITDAGERRAVLQSVGDAPTLLITEGLLMYLPGQTVEALTTEAAQTPAIRCWMLDLTSPDFAKRSGTDSHQAIQNVRDPNHLDGAQTLETLLRNNWTSANRRLYGTDAVQIGLARIQQIMARSNMPPGPPPPAGDYSGVHIFSRA